MIDDGHSKSERNSSDETKGLSVSELANMLSLSGDVEPFGLSQLFAVN